MAEPEGPTVPMITKLSSQEVPENLINDLP